MLPNGLARRITLAYVALIVGVAAALGVYLTAALRTAQLDRLLDQLAAEARLIAVSTRPTLRTGDASRVDASARLLAATIAARVTVIAADGTVLGDSQADPATLENHAGRAEVAAVLAGGALGSSTRYSASVGRDLLYVAAPILDGDRVIGVARVAREVAGVEAEVRRAIGVVLAAVAVAALLGVVLASVVARRVTEPIGRLTRTARRMTQSDLGRPGGGERGAWAGRRDEIGELGRAFEEMAGRLRTVIDDLSTDRGRLAAVLAAMADGLMLIDREERVVLANRAAARLLDVPERALDAGGAEGIRLIEFVHDHELHELVRGTAARGGPRSELIRLGSSGHNLRITATRMRGGSAAVLLLIQNVTEIRRAETIRRDFVANVSHELRTPIASVKALVETLEDGALEDPPAAREFLHRMHVEVDRMAQLVQELLDLARIESGRAKLTLEARDPAELVAAAAERLRAQADRAGVTLAVSAQVGLPPVRADAGRIEGAIVNLVHNAIKFTPAGGRVEVRAEAGDPGAVRVSVRDTGVGIPAEDLPRIFERFYKTDRSRASSGTGLGLAIVKHVVQAHGGQVGASSDIGSGSTFWFTLITAQTGVPAGSSVRG